MSIRLNRVHRLYAIATGALSLSFWGDLCVTSQDFGLETVYFLIVVFVFSIMFILLLCLRKQGEH